MDQVERNYQAFKAKLPELIKSNPGKFALMHDGDITGFYDTARDAYTAGVSLYPGEGTFSIQEVVDTPVDLGFFSHAVS